MIYVPVYDHVLAPGFTDGICAAQPVQFPKSSALNKLGKARPKCRLKECFDRKVIMRRAILNSFSLCGGAG